MRCWSIHLVKKMYQVPADMMASTTRMALEIQEPFGPDVAQRILGRNGVGSGAGGLLVRPGQRRGLGHRLLDGRQLGETGATLLRLKVKTTANAIVSFLKFIFLLRG